MRSLSRRFLWRLVAAPGLLVLTFISWVMWSEWYTIGVVADPDVIAKYYFGSDAMMQNGGEYYASAEAYARSALIVALVFAPALITFLAAVIRGTKRLTVIAMGLFVLAACINWLV